VKPVLFQKSRLVIVGFSTLFRVYIGEAHAWRAVIRRYLRFSTLFRVYIGEANGDGLPAPDCRSFSTLFRVYIGEATGWRLPFVTIEPVSVPSSGSTSVKLLTRNSTG